ncbi:hypothetical protein [Methanotorris formicicus]|uniref:hypothetical protein n=1 Tax=Methanotorris formicicus TaxID=213185 RepID=UPI00114537BE|nr:hypothetical protein [Methanotorris formicicus]
MYFVGLLQLFFIFLLYLGYLLIDYFHLYTLLSSYIVNNKVSNNLESYLTTVVSVIGTVFGIVITISAIIIQHVSGERGYVLMDIFFKDKIFKGYLIWNIFVIMVFIICILFPLTNNTTNEIIFFIILTLSCFIGLFFYLSRVIDYLKPDKCIEIVLYNNSNKNLDDRKIYSAYKIIRKFIELEEMDAVIYGIKGLERSFNKLYNRETSGNNNIRFINNITTIIGLLGLDIIKYNKINVPYGCEVLKTSIETLYKSAKVKINNSADIYWEINTIMKIYKNYMLIAEDEEREGSKSEITKNIIEYVGDLFKEEIRKLDGGLSNDWNIRWCYDAFKEMAIMTIPNITTNDLDYSELLNKLLETAYNPDGEYNFIEKIIKGGNRYRFIFNSMMNTLNQILKEIHKNNLEDYDFSDKIYKIYKIILENSYIFKKYDIFYNVINDVKEINKRFILKIKNAFYIPITTKNEKNGNIEIYTTFELSDVGKKLQIY